MANIRRGTIATGFVDSLKLDIGNRDAVPNETSEKVVLTYDFKNSKRCDIVRSVDATNATSGTIYTTPSDKDFYLVAATLSLMKDASAVSTESTIALYVDGALRKICNIAGITTTAQSETQNISCNIPIKVDRNTNISVTNASATAVIKSIGSIVGFTIDN